MSGIDISQIVNQAQNVADNSGSLGGGKYKYRLVYPGNGVLKVKLLYSPQSKMLMRLIRRHRIGKDQIPCLSMWDQSCPLCEAVEEAENLTGSDLWKLGSNARAVMYAQYVGSDNYTWTSDFPEPQEREVILLMVPWSVYVGINEIVAEAGPNAAKLIAENEGKLLMIKKSNEGGRVTYQASIDGWTDSYKSFETDEEYIQHLTDLEPLQDHVVPNNITQDIINENRQAAQQIKSEFVSHNVLDSTVSPGSSMAGGNFNTTPAAPTDPSTMSSQDLITQGIPNPQSQKSSASTPPSGEGRRVNPITGQVQILQNGQWINTNEYEPTNFNG